MDSKIESKREYMMFLTRARIKEALTRDIKIEEQAKKMISEGDNPNDVFAIYYTNPDIRILRAELITKENFSDYLKA